MKSQNLVFLAAALFFVAAPVFGAGMKWKDRVGSNSLSDEPRAENSPSEVLVPPSGMPSSSLSVVDPSGNGMAKRDHYDIYAEEASPSMHKHAMRGHMRHDWTADDDMISSTSGAPVNEHYFAYYGEDIPALRGLQLEMAMNRLHHLNLKEVELAKMAETRAKSEDVLHLAHQIRADHEALETKVQALAHRRNIKLETFQLATYEKAVRDRLSHLNGVEFESAFLRVNERGHDEAERALRTVRNDLSDTETRNLINEALPKMSAHRIVPQNRARARVEEGELGD